MTGRFPRGTSRILGQVAADHDISIVDLLGTGRDTATARRDAAHRLADLGLSSSTIGAALGGRDHTTILHALTQPRPDADPQPIPDLDGCAVDGCDRDVKAMQVCSGHHQRWVRTGRLDTDRPLRGFRKSVLDLEVHDRRGYRAGCGCDTCRADAVRHVKRSRHRPLRVPVADGQRALEKAVARGWTVPKIAQRVGVGSACLYSWRHGRVEMVLRATVDAVNALDAPPVLCEDCDQPSLAGGRWCFAHFQTRANPPVRRSTGCGTDAGYTAHRRAGTTPCQACKAGHRLAHELRQEVA